MVIVTEKEQLANILIDRAKKGYEAKVVESNTKKDEKVYERGTWGSQFDFAFSCIAYAVGLGNVWRFPYLCFKNGGGAFLIPYFFSMAVCGIPLFFLEVSIGQYLGVGGMSVVGQLAPILKGVGYSAMMMVFLENVYYIIVVTWTLFYLFATFMDLPSLPWSSCEKGNGTWANEKCWNPDDGIAFINSSAFKQGITPNNTETAVEQFWNNEVLHMSGGIDEVGGVQWDLFGYLILAWTVVYCVIWKGLHNSGKNTVIPSRPETWPATAAGSGKRYFLVGNCETIIYNTASRPVQRPHVKAVRLVRYHGLKQPTITTLTFH